MKKNYTFYSLLAAIPVALILLVGFTGGQGGDYSGSPGDGNANCTSCHASGANHGGSVTLTGVPANYVPGNTYSLTLSINGSSVNKFGFNITAESVTGGSTGIWTAGTGSRLRDGGASDGLTHSSAGTASNSWTFDWRAPASDQGPITFYYATIQANSNSANSGDQTLTGSVTAAVLSNDNDLQTLNYNMYPTVVQDQLTIVLQDDDSGSLEIYSINGQLVKSNNLQQSNQINLSALSSGVYITNVTVGGKTSTQRIIKK